MQTPAHSLAIIGAGIAGLTAARLLHDRGLSLTVFDKGRSPGGRISTRRAESEIRFDHGAQYFTARDERFARHVREWITQGSAAEWTGRIVRLEAGEVTETSPLPRYVGVPGMSALATSLARDLTIRANTTISQLNHDASGWQLHDLAGGSHGPFHSLILAIPAPQAAVLLADHPLGEVCRGVPMEPCWAVMVAFTDRLPVPFDGAFVHGSPLGWIARNSSKPGRLSEPDHWVLHATPEWSAANLEASPERIIPQLLDAFAETIGSSLPTMTLATAHRWRYARGADPDERRACLHDPETRLTVTGDWLHGGRVEGAFLAGWEAARRIPTAQE
jgi:predicted NAD/FAD-dependent oxidoreductase